MTLYVVKENPYSSQESQSKLATSLKEVAKSRFCYVDMNTKEVKSTHVFHRIYEWFKGRLGGQDMCNEKLVSFYLMREVNLLEEATTLSGDTKNSINAIAQRFNLLPGKNSEPQTQTPSAAHFFQSVFNSTKLERAAKEEDIRAFYKANPELFKYVEDYEINDFFSSVVYIPGIIPERVDPFPLHDRVKPEKRNLLNPSSDSKSATKKFSEIPSTREDTSIENSKLYKDYSEKERDELLEKAESDFSLWALEDSEGNTILHYSADRISDFPVLLKKENQAATLALLKKENTKGETPLGACNANTLKFLSEKVDEEYFSELLEGVFRYQNTENVQDFISHVSKEALRRQDKEGRNALHLAVDQLIYSMNPKIISTLLNSVPDCLNVKNAKGISAFEAIFKTRKPFRGEAVELAEKNGFKDLLDAHLCLLAEELCEMLPPLYPKENESLLPIIYACRIESELRQQNRTIEELDSNKEAKKIFSSNYLFREAMQEIEVSILIKEQKLMPPPVQPEAPPMSSEAPSARQEIIQALAFNHAEKGSNLASMLGFPELANDGMALRKKARNVMLKSHSDRGGGDKEKTQVASEILQLTREGDTDYKEYLEYLEYYQNLKKSGKGFY